MSRDAAWWIRSLTLEGNPSSWGATLQRAFAEARESMVFDRTLADWQRIDRPAIGLTPDTPVLATGHQTLLWHPGILAKYLVVERLRRSLGCAAANLVVDQHVNSFGQFDWLQRTSDGALQARTCTLTDPMNDVPMGVHPPFAPAVDGDEPDSVQRIVQIIARHAQAPNAAVQMARTLTELMAPWVEPWPMVTATALLRTSLGQALLTSIRDDPHAAVGAYNEAVLATPEAQIGPLQIRDDYVEVPLWRLRPDGRRMHAWDNDIDRWLDGDPDIILMPRALLLTALIRLVLCDAFVHGIGGGIYDRAMERWLCDWIGVVPAPAFIVSATVWMPQDEVDPELAEAALQRAAVDADLMRRRFWHDPERAHYDVAASMSRTKHKWLSEINAAPRKSAKRRAAFHAMHDWARARRHTHADAQRRCAQDVRTARSRAATASVARRRDWPFALYPDDVVDALESAINERLRDGASLTTPQ